MTTNIPGPQLTPILGVRGNIYQFRSDPLGYMSRVHRRYGSIAAFACGIRSSVFAFGPEYNQQILGDPILFQSMGLPYPAPRDSAQERITYSLFNLNGSAADRFRRAIMPAFHKRVIDGFRDSIVAETLHTLESWQTGQAFDLVQSMRRLMMRVAAYTLFGIPRHTQIDGIDDLMNRWVRLSTSAAVRLVPRAWPGTPFQRMLQLAEQLEQRVTAIVRCSTATGTGTQLLPLLREMRDENDRSMSERELIGHVIILLGTAHDTSTNTLAWTFFLLAQHPWIMEQLQNELAILDGVPPRADQLNQLPFLDCVLKESLRILPPVPYSTRLSTAPFRLGPYDLPQGTTVIFSHYITHHLPELYSSPASFQPHRWLTIKPGPYEYLPFGAGPRTCIGAPFAVTSIKIVLATVLQRYRLTLPARSRVNYHVNITLTPRGGLPMVPLPMNRSLRRSRVRGNIGRFVDLKDGKDDVRSIP